ncbi:MAG: Hydroxyacylglutathione hydrolase [Alphaproteobacteria bacterium ADurb.BinA280]|jgi:hydroxyacylglutathione hydrolase|nr:hydroxyacylglutathione hydrolase [Xanthomonadales bacterium]OPZ12501.1 MAG: Hydroxyacylglutathione hydrolase [Alphaproteobacteria bacterium ADurb.BinA280]
MHHLIALPALDDNYIWFLRQSDRPGVLVDPGDAEVAIRAMDAGMAVAAILVTHHHGDHVAAIELLQARYGLPVFAPADVRIPGTWQAVADGASIAPAGTDLHFEVMAVPGHTRSHVAYFGAGHLFCGDTLFSLGCGRLFEGSPAQMHASLQRIAQLPANTLICPAHEYTLSNGHFAQHVDPHNAALSVRLAEVSKQRAAGLPSVPTRLHSELQCNPFLRVGEVAIQQAVAQHCGAPLTDPVAVFAGLRRWKDEFR